MHSRYTVRSESPIPCRRTKESRMSRSNTRARTRRSAALALVASMALHGCATPEAPDLDPRVEAATAAFGGGFDYVYVPSKGRLADEAFLSMSRVAGPQKVARDLATLMAPAETEAVRVMVTGPNEEKTLQVILDALSFYEGRRIPKLDLLYLGSPTHEARLARELSKVGAKLRFAPYQARE